jgi:excisionase family DNA binding protein
MSVNRPIPRYALTKAEAAASLGMSVDSFERHVQSDLKLVRLGKLRLIPPSELERWVAERAEPVLNGNGNG